MWGMGSEVWGLGIWDWGSGLKEQLVLVVDVVCLGGIFVYQALGLARRRGVFVVAELWGLCCK